MFLPVSALDPREEEKRTINFVLMTRKGNKQQVGNLSPDFLQFYLYYYPNS